MRLEKSFSVIALIILLCLICSCTREDNNLEAKVSSPGENVIDLTSRIYEDSQLLEIVKFSGAINELDAQYPIECLRVSSEIYRVAYLGAEKVAILLFDDSGNKLFGRSIVK